MKKASCLIVALLAFSSAASAVDDKTLTGAAVGGVAGAVIGNAAGGENGTVAGAAIGAVAGAIIANSDRKPIASKLPAQGAAPVVVQPVAVQPVAVQPVGIRPVAVRPVAVQPEPVPERRGYDEERRRHRHHDNGNHYGERKHRRDE